ncbi:sulfotransferase family 2 domain-containing protein, partial [Acinetobacter baumannii]
AFVRNPFTRVLSGFLDKIRRNQPQKAQILRMSGRSGHDLSVEISFSEFIDAICAMPDSMLDVHWALQSQVIFLDSINYDFIGRFEQL